MTTALKSRFLAVPSVRLQTIAAWICLLTQGLISVTGAVVRVTSSGLGCPSWPGCFHDSPIPRPDSLVPWQHQAIEFGNRTLTGIVSIAAITIAVMVTRAQRRRVVFSIGWAMVGGTLAQAVLGGITVLAGLQWWTVALHLLASMVMVWLATILVITVRQPDDAFGDPFSLSDSVSPQPSILTSARTTTFLRLTAVVSTALLASVLVAGTLVTGAGPHAGDKSITKPVERLPLDIPLLAQVHSTLVLLYLFSLAVLLWLSRRASPSIRRATLLVLCSAIAQATVGEVQYWQGVPIVLVVIHVAGAVTVTSLTAAVWALCAHSYSPRTSPFLTLSPTTSVFSRPQGTET